MTLSILRYDLKSFTYRIKLMITLIYLKTYRIYMISEISEKFSIQIWPYKLLSS